MCPVPSDASSMPDPSARQSLELLYHINRELASDLDLQTVLQRVLELSLENVGAISGSIIVLDEQRRPTETAFQFYGRPHDEGLLQLRLTYEQGLAGWVAQRCEPVLIPDTSQDERWLRRPDDDCEQTGPKSAVSVPILSRRGLVGVMTLVHPVPGFFNQDHLALVQAIADPAGIAILNARLYAGLQAAHRRYRELFEDSIDPILITDLDGQILEANRQAAGLMHLSGDPLISSAALGNAVDYGILVEDFLGPGFERLAHGETISYECDLAAGGLVIPVQVNARRVQIDGVPHIQWILRDISERKRLDTLREDLISMIYHDLRSPLANVISSLDVLQAMAPVKGDPTLEQLLSIATRSLQRILRLTNSLLDINRLEAGQSIANPELYEAPALIREAVELVAAVALSREIALEIQVPASLPAVRVDVDMIRRVIVNLIENAIKFTPPEGKISVGATVEPGFLRIWVQDTGRGMSAEEKERIFSKYTQFGAGGGMRGLGLGLAFCRLAVQGHGGQIEVESEPGTGSRFSFTLPLPDDRNPGQAALPLERRR